MYRLLYKRRYYLYVAIITFVFSSIFFKTHTPHVDNFISQIEKPLLINIRDRNYNDDENQHQEIKDIEPPPPIKNQNENDKTENLKKQRITIDTYVSPPPCIGCPGENGTGVVLSVRDHELILRDTSCLIFKLTV